MAIDNKYGKVTLERGTIGEDEPVIVFRAQDKTLSALLIHYDQICQAAGSPQHHLDLIEDTRQKILAWQDENSDKIKTPSSNAFAPDDA